MNATSPTLSAKLAQISLQLKPSQAFVYDPSDNTFTLLTECIVSSEAADELARIVKGRHDDEFIAIERYTDEYKITFARSVEV